jgi:hypothetical protein
LPEEATCASLLAQNIAKSIPVFRETQRNYSNAKKICPYKKLDKYR